MKNILYISTSLFPYGQAYSTRLVNFSRLFKDLNYSVHIITDFTYEEYNQIEREKQFENCTYQIVGGKPTSFNRIKSTFLSTRIINEYLNNNNVDLVILGNCYDRFNRVRRMCNERNIPMILEVCEWYDTKTRKLGNLNPYNIIYNKRIKNDYRHSDGVIAISRYLYDYFQKYGKKTIRIPTILDSIEMSHTVEINNEKIVLVQIGLSGLHKEKFKNILLALSLLGEKKKLFEYHIYGSDKDTVLKNMDNDEKLLNELTDCVFIEGKIPQTEVNDVYKKADFSIFIRPEKRSSEAGFPTKLAESMIAGTPVITNKTGDIDLYLNNEEEGFLLKEGSSEEIVDVLKKILVMKKEEKKTMRKKARKMAENNFDYRSYLSEMESFLKKMN